MNETTIEGLKKFTEEENRKFAKMNKQRKRVRIAKDVLAALDQRRIKANKGMYLTGLPSGFAWDEAASAREKLAEIPSCQVCAKAAILTCTIMRRNKVTVKQLSDNRGVDGMRWSGANLSKLLGGIFSPEQLRLIEVEYEGEDVEGKWGMHSDRIAPVMSLSGWSDEERLRAIMKNIIANKGTFVPSASQQLDL